MTREKIDTEQQPLLFQAPLESADVTLVDQTEYRLPPDQWEKFCQRLAEPPKVIPQLRRLFQDIRQPS